MEAAEFYVGHDLAIRAVYNDPWALPLAEFVAAIPKIGEAPAMSRLVDQAWTKRDAPALRPAEKAVRKR